jgi:hypothetical protein
MKVYVLVIDTSAGVTCSVHRTEEGRQRELVAWVRDVIDKGTLMGWMIDNLATDFDDDECVVRDYFHENEDDSYVFFEKEVRE